MGALFGPGKPFAEAEITFDRFYVVRLLNEAVEKARRTEQKERPELKRSRWLWLWNPERPSPAQAAQSSGWKLQFPLWKV